MNSISDQRHLISRLQDPRCYPHRVKRVRVIETHISWVLLAGRYAYKIKKALNLGFLDYSTLSGRRYYCEEELRLNRRLAPKLYLDVVPIGGASDNLNIGTQPAIEYAVRMRRFAESHLMERQLKLGRISARHMDSLAATLVKFHDNLPRAPAESAYGEPATIHAATKQNSEHLEALLRDEDRMRLVTLKQENCAEFTRCEASMALRNQHGLVRECHGDLHLGNLVLLADEPVPFDGIEFNPGLRWIDVMNEIAFTVMDLLHHGQAEHAFHLLNAYLEGGGDYAGIAVLRYYLAYRAMVRAKVWAIRASQSGLSKRVIQDELAVCRSYLTLAEQMLTRKTPALIITHGLPGSGKSTFSQLALERLPGIRIRSDVERKRLFGLNALDNSAASGVDIYSKAATLKTYAHLVELAGLILDAGWTVIVDAAFLRQEERAKFQKLAHDRAVPFVIASISASNAVLHTRIAIRQKQFQDASEADDSVLHNLQKVLQPLTDEERNRSVEFINDRDQSGLSHAEAWGRLQGLLADS
jgi:uncharacterized protein